MLEVSYREVTLTIELCLKFIIKDCGADYVKTRQACPPALKMCPGGRYASLDGDADRLVYYFEKDSKFFLLDGDRIACLIATFLQKKLGSNSSVKMGVVQTAYANGASTNYLKSLGQFKF